MAGGGECVDAPGLGLRALSDSHRGDCTLISVTRDEGIDMDERSRPADSCSAALTVGVASAWHAGHPSAPECSQTHVIEALHVFACM